MNLATAIDLVLNLISQAASVGALIAKARAEGRNSLSNAEVDELMRENDTARAGLQAAIEDARAAGR